MFDALLAARDDIQEPVENDGEIVMQMRVMRAYQRTMGERVRNGKVAVAGGERRKFRERWL